MSHTAVSSTQASLVAVLIWQHGAKVNYYNLAIFNRIATTKTRIIQIEPDILNIG